MISALIKNIIISNILLFENNNNNIIVFSKYHLNQCFVNSMNKNFLFAIIAPQYVFHNSKPIKLICNLYENFIYI